MKNIKVRKIMPRIAAILLIPFILTGCAERSKCDLKTNHVHLYTKTKNNATISTYLKSENMKYDDYDWTEDCIEITREDEPFYQAKGKLFEGVQNWDYLYNVMASKKDYLEFYYSYSTTGVTVSIDSKGHTKTKLKTVHHSGWDTDPTHRGVTGETRLCHHRFYGYRIVLENGKYRLYKSQPVDDIRDIIGKYPYYSEDCVEIITKDYEFKEEELPKLKVSDFDYFKGPNLEDKELNSNTK
jgi:hypothetical protein